MTGRADAPIYVADGGSPPGGYGQRQRERHLPASTADGSVSADDLLSAGVGDRSLRFSLRVLHGGRHDLPAQARSSDAGRAGPAVLGLRPAGRQEAADHRRRAAGAARHHDAVPVLVAASGYRRAGRTDRHDERVPARQARGRPRRLRRQAGECLARYARSRQIPQDHPLGRPRTGDRGDRRRTARGAQDQDQRRRPERRQRGRV